MSSEDLDALFDRGGVAQAVEVDESGGAAAVRRGDRGLVIVVIVQVGGCGEGRGDEEGVVGVDEVVVGGWRLFVLWAEVETAV